MLIEGLYTTDHFSFEDNTVNASITLNNDHDIFKGHFPGNPILPGVCSIQIIKELTEKALDRSLFLSVSSNVKFLETVNPEANPKLVLSIAISEVEEVIKVKAIISYNDTIALNLRAQFKNLEDTFSK
ncbi:3-hydroxyacyl-ACP dehydratase [Croceibacter atlanticus]|jgi:3-hydroxyacyl-[acyl-carrier-protein] dehydratase|uniref:ApeI dehydratase-like domain-containing protein n=1 Tax=Croceibacter atlanticus (strain ATCC BAA-628 / JCM 21780 / CIP 108009 / IAM 15332 / KCTC 12090 / HTCC2559) TaxID=216432 RepID=A3U6J0_CROAH|nr:3-hydroxyacyl-ACP dehydratase [Croceibacter atlanticus]EAP87857.1 hypothetical protein CA2559_03840 [Croceibacter atlanticus HTCC2559]MBW4969913.1 3-hydroxyacyl-ACP dehydratase [Croceibacter atlanticus]